MNPLILRPEPAASTLAALLRAHGFQPTVCPLFEYQMGVDIPRLPTLLAQSDFVIATSAAALEFASSTVIDWPQDCRYFSVGQTTARLWLSHSIPVHIPQDERSEGLLALPDLQSVAGKRILILRGESGRTLLADELTQRGAQVTYSTCYERQTLPYCGETLCADWQSKSINSVIITSSDIFFRLMSLVPATAMPWLIQLHWIAVSPRVANDIRQHGFRSVFISGGARHEQVLAALQQLEDKKDE